MNLLLRHPLNNSLRSNITNHIAISTLTERAINSIIRKCKSYIMTEENKVATLIQTQSEKKVLESVQSSVINILKNRVILNTLKSLKHIKDE